MYVAGTFSLVGNHRIGSLTRLNPDGTPDETFNYRGPKLTGDYITEIAVSSDSILLVTGSMSGSGFLVLKKDGSTAVNFSLDAAISRVFGATFYGDKYLLLARMSGFTESHKLLLLNRDGSIDETFNPVSLSVSGQWARFGVLSDGSILIIGNITQFGGTPVGRVIRLNSDLTLDDTFEASNITESYRQIRSLTVQPDDKIILAGSFTSYGGTDTPGGLIRLNSDGTVDTDFIVGPVGNVINRGAHDVSMLSDGKIVVVGLNYSDYLKYQIVKLNADGSINSVFDPDLIRYNDLDDTRMFVNDNDEIFIAGDFVFYSTETLPGFVAFDAEGNSLPINPKIGNKPYIKDAIVQNDGKILVVGDFYEVNGQDMNQIARLFPDGSLDTTFDPGIVLWNTQKSRVSSVALQSDGKIIVGGYFVQVGLTNHYNNLIRLTSDGSLDATFDPKVSPRFVDQGVTEILVGEDDGIVIGGSFGHVGTMEVGHFAKVDANGTVVTTFNADNIFPTYSWVNSIIQSSTGGYIVAGTGYNPSVGFIYSFDDTGTFTKSFGDDIDLSYVAINDIVVTNDKLVFGGTTSGGGFANQPIPLHIVNLDGTGLDDISINATGQGNFASYSKLIDVGNEELIIGGYFEKVNGSNKSGLARVKLNGFVDPNFDFRFDGSVSLIIKEDDETLLVFGQFSSIDDYEYGGLARLKFVNTPPRIITFNGSSEIYEDNSVGIDLTDFEVEDDDDAFPEEFTLLIQPGENYTVSGNLVTPELDFNGTITVSMKVSDGKEESNVYDVEIEVIAVDDPPVITGLKAPLSMNENTSLTLSLLDFIVTDPDNTFPDDFSLTLENGPNYSIDGLKVVPDKDFFGKLFVRAKVSDGESYSQVFESEVTVISTNTSPVIKGTVSPLSTPEETSLEINIASLIITDPDDTFPDDFTLFIEAGNNYTVTGLTITPAIDFNGTLTVPIKVYDSEAYSPLYNLSVDVSPVNDTPVITAYTGNVIGQEDTPLVFSLNSFTVTDPDNTFPADFSFTLLPGDHYSVDGAHILPGENYTGGLSIPATLSDGAATSASYVINATIQAINDVPVISAYSGQVNTPEDSPFAIDLTKLTVSDPDNTFPTDFTLVILSGDNYTVAGSQITPGANFNGTVTVPVKVSDGVAESDVFNLTIDVTPVNDAPVITSYSGPLEMDENTTLTLSLENFAVSDPDNEYPQGFSLAISAGENYVADGATIAPDAGFSGELEVTVSVNDGVTSSEPFELTIAINEVTGILELNRDISIFPVPAKNELTLRIDGQVSGTVILSLVDVSGNLVLTQQALKGKERTEVKVDLQHLNGGVYIIQVQLPGREIVQKRIIID